MPVSNASHTCVTKPNGFASCDPFTAEISWVKMADVPKNYATKYKGRPVVIGKV